MGNLKKDWVRRADYDLLKQDLAHSNDEIQRLKALVEPLPFAAKANGIWNGDMLHDWIEGKPPTNPEHRKLYTTIWAYRKREFESGVAEGMRKAKLQEVGL